MKKELDYTKLKTYFNPDNFNFTTTDELTPIETGIGQERGIKALEFGLEVDCKGYNVYLEGPSGVGKTMYCKNYVEKLAKTKKVPNDWVYVYNFENPNEPIAIDFPAGSGKLFKEAIDDFIKEIKKDIKKSFNADDFEKQKNLIKKDFEDKKNIIMEELNQRTASYSFTVKSAQNGIYMMPVYEGKTIEEDEFDNLPANIKDKYESDAPIVQELIMEVIGKIKQLEKASDKKIQDYQSNIILVTVNTHISYIKSQFKKSKKITKFLNDIKKDILLNLDYFINEDKEKEKRKKSKEPINPMLTVSDPSDNYRVNLFVDNSELEGAPVIMDSNYSYSNIFGAIEYENYYGSLRTDFNMLKPGLMQKANGGYIIFQAKDLLSNPYCYEMLKKAIRIKQIGIENLQDSNSSMVMISLKPEPIPLDLKILLIGNSTIYQTLLCYDDDFRKLFKIKAEFEDDAPISTENALNLARFAKGFTDQENLLPLDRKAMAKIVEFSSKLTGQNNKVSTRYTEISQVIGEASTWAKLEKAKIIQASHVDKALCERIQRVKKFDNKYLEMIKENDLLISTTGHEIGQVNGLTVLSLGDYSFGKPARITVNTYAGKKGLINIEREVELSGSSHSKGVSIITGYLGELFAQNFPLCVNASICFEQLYNGVDGDSASSTELYAILSSLSELPISQSIAVTGSVNQKGMIQPIGGVNEKIEGFFQICEERGLTGEHGVIIPKQNVKNLQLSDNVIKAVKNGLFHIYPVENIEQGIEILTGVPAGKKNKSGTFPAGTVNFLVQEKLKKYYSCAKDF